VSVARLSISQVRAIMEGVGELESTCAKLARAGWTKPCARSSTKRCSVPGRGGGRRHEEYATANARFHEVIYAGSRNPYLADLIRHARRQIHRYRPARLRHQGADQQVAAGPPKIARAIQEGDEAAAALQMLLHVPSGSTGFSEFLARIPMSLFEAEAGEA
jgi:DNA-binding GntR family transcriptional regulator